MVGLNVASDPLFTAGYIGVNGGMVLVVADDPGIYSSQNEQDTRMIARAAMVPVVEPSDSEEARYFTKRAYELSEKYDTPVILRTTTRLAHSQGIVNLEDRVEVDDKPYERNIAKNVMMPGNAIKRHVIVEQRLKQKMHVTLILIKLNIMIQRLVLLQVVYLISMLRKHFLMHQF